MTAILPGHTIVKQPAAQELGSYDVLSPEELRALGSLPRQVVYEFDGSENDKGAPIIGRSDIGSKVIHLTTTTAHNQATLYSTLQISKSAAYVGPRISSEEVTHRRAKGQWPTGQHRVHNGGFRPSDGRMLE